MNKLALQGKVPREYNAASIQEIVRLLEYQTNAFYDQIDALESSVDTLEDMVPQLATEVAPTSGTSIDFTGIPSWVKKITIQFVGVSTDGTDHWLIQLGDSGGVEPTGYLGAGSTTQASVSTTNFTSGFGFEVGTADAVGHGVMVLTLEDAATFRWVAGGVLARSDATFTYTTAGSKSLSAALDRVRITTVGGTDEFDAGAINILYE